MEIRPKEAVRQNNKRYTIRQVKNIHLAKEPFQRARANPTIGNQSRKRDDDLTRDKQDKSIRQTIAKKQLAIRRRSTALRQANQQVKRQSIGQQSVGDEQQEDTPSSERNIFNSADREVQQQIYRQSRQLVLQMAARNAHHGASQKIKARQTSVSEETAGEANAFLDGHYQNANIPSNREILFDTATDDSLKPVDLIHSAGSATSSQTTEAAERFKRTRSAQSLQQKTEARQLRLSRNKTLARQVNHQSLLADNQKRTNQQLPNQRITMTNRQSDEKRGKAALRSPSMRPNEPNVLADAAPAHNSLFTQKALNQKHHAVYTISNPNAQPAQIVARQAERRKKTAINRLISKNRITSQHTSLPTPVALSGKPAKRLFQLAQAVSHVLKHFTHALLAIGAAILLVAAFFAAFAALLFSPFGIFFSGQDADNHTIAMAVAEINQAFNDKLDAIETNAQADKVIYHRLPDGEGRFITNWPDIVAVFAVKTAGGNDDSSMDVLTIDATRIDFLQDIFNDMNVVTYQLETIHHPGEGENSTGQSETILHITIASKSYTDMADQYHFTPAQTQALDELMKPEYAQMLSELVGTYGGAGTTVTITDGDLQKLLDKLPEDLSPQRRAVITNAFSLVGKVHYFWGGKSQTIGWDNRWGTITKVTAADSRTTGTSRPFGLDCSGFVDWVFINTVGDNVGQGGGAASQYHNSQPITWTEALPGDLVFYPDLGHVGIICGKDDNGSLLVVHCASSQNNVVVTGLNGFTKIRRPIVLSN